MTGLMTHRGYAPSLAFDQQDRVFGGRIANIRDVVGFHASTLCELRVAFHEAVDDYIDTCARIGKHPQNPAG